MENSLGLDVHGAAGSQGQPPDNTQSTGDSWGILADTAEHDGSNDTTESWGPAEGEVSWGPVATEDSWGPAITEDSWGPATTKDNWGPTTTEDSWGPAKEATTTPKANNLKKDKGDSWGMLEDDGNTSPTQKDDRSKKDKGTAYVPAVPPARAKMSPDELAERMEKIRLQNEKIKERREHVRADEEAFNTSVAADRARQAANRKVQAQINQNREQNAKKKLEKMGNREWDSGKQDGEWKQSSRGRGKSSFGSSKDRGRQPVTGNARNAIDASLPGNNGSNTPVSHKELPYKTSQNAAGSSHLRSDTQDVVKQD